MTLRNAAATRSANSAPFGDRSGVVIPTCQSLCRWATGNCATSYRTVDAWHRQGHPLP